MAGTIVAVYEDIQTARAAIEALVYAGINREAISMIVSDHDEGYSRMLREGDRSAGYEEDVTSSEGAGFGAGIGAITGLAVGLAAITVPGVGPIIAAGPLAAALGGLAGAGIGAAAGAVTGGITAALIDSGVPEDHAGYYAEALRRGHVIVAIDMRDGDDANRVREILGRHGAVDIERLSAYWEHRGWHGYDAAAPIYTTEEAALEREDYRQEATAAEIDRRVRERRQADWVGYPFFYPY